MKQLLSALLKLFGFYLLYLALFGIVYNFFYIYLFNESGDVNDGYYLLLIFIQPILQITLFLLLVFKTEAIIKLFRLDSNSDVDVPYESILKLGIFLIGFYFFITSFPNFLTQFLKLIKKELFTFSRLNFTEAISPFNMDSFLQSVILCAISLLAVFGYKSIARFFIKREKSDNLQEN